jgi:hypothetical protein
MTRSPASRQTSTCRLALTALSALAVTGASVLAMPAVAAADPSPAWHSYVQDPSSSDVRPIAVTPRGAVANPAALLDGGSTTTTLTTTLGGAPASVLLDFGKDVSGLPYFDVTSVSGPATLSMATSEAREFIRTPASTTTTATADAGATTVLVASTKNMVVGDQITFGAGASQQVRSITAITPEVGVSIDKGLDRSVESGAVVTTSPGAPSSDEGSGGLSGHGGVKQFTVEAAGHYTPDFRGGYRFVLLTLDSPGAITLSGAGTTFQSFHAPADRYRGWFLSSSDTLNKMWYDGAYTVHLDMSPKGTGDSTVNRVLDGGKRDRSIWTGDLLVEDPVIWQSVGQQGVPYIKDSLQLLFARQADSGELPGSPDFVNGFVPGGFAFNYSNNYSGYGVRALIDYYRHTGDADFTRTLLAAARKELAYNATFLDAKGLVASNDRDYWQIEQDGEVTKYSLDYYVLLREMAWLERHLGTDADANAYDQQAVNVRRSIIANLWSRDLGAYPQSNTSDVLVEDANALALEYGIYPAGGRQSILTALRKLWTGHGAIIGTGLVDPYGHTIEPYGNGLETDARFVADDASGALSLMLRTWGQMVDETNPWYTGAFWEFIGPGGSVLHGNDSLAHGWAASPTQQLTERVLGITPIGPGYSQWDVHPHLGGLDWARGEVPTPNGTINVSWTNQGRAGFRLVVDAPTRTSGTITVPAGRYSTVTLDGKIIWSRHTHRAQADGQNVTISVPHGGRYVITRSK